MRTLIYAGPSVYGFHDWKADEINYRPVRQSDLITDIKFFTDVKQDDFTVRVHGDTAVAAGLSDSKVEYKGKPSGGALRFTRVYMKRDGRWVMITSHATRR